MPRSKHILRNFIQILSFVTILQGGLAFASVSGSISGTVKDSAGSVVPGAEVHLREGGTGTEYRAASDAHGFYTLPVLP
ncbi:MAG: carboxypeptidase-like regulatory domain-containing protein, partial [Terracidiphilus sp.]